MHSRIKSLTLVLLIAVAIFLMAPGIAFGQSPSLDNFNKHITYSNNQFRDVSAPAWYVTDVKSAYQMGLIKGKSTNYFDPTGEVTLAETITLAARIHSIYYRDTSYFNQGYLWYEVYVEYALDNKIIEQRYSNYNKKINRAQFASILINALPAAALADINSITDGYILDIPNNASYSDDVYKLYRAGILQGSNTCGDFRPTSSIKRCEVAAIINRMANTDNRIPITHTHTNVCYNDYAFPQSMANEALDLINAQRQTNLVADPKHYQAASQRAGEINNSNIPLSHTRPNNLGYWTTVLRDFDISWHYCGENIARGHSSASSVITGLMASTDHKKVFTNPNYKKIGIAYTSYGNGYAWAFILTD